MAIPGMTAAKRKKERKKKPDELLSSVVHETATAGVVDLLKKNEKFAFPSGTAWVMLGLSSEAVGGLSRRQSRDEAKGSIIKLIENDAIETVATAEMLAEEVFGVIPTVSTLQRMDEYSLLTEAEYSWAVVWETGEGDLHVEFVGDATFPQTQQIAAGTLSLEQAVGRQAWADHSGLSGANPADAPASDPTQATDIVDTPADEDSDEIFASPNEDDSPTDNDDDAPVFDDLDTDEEPDFQVPEPEPIGEPAPASEASVATEGPGDEGFGIEEIDEDDTAVDEPMSAEATEGVYADDQETVRDGLARRFLPEDLDLGIRLDEFNRTFSIGAPAVQLEVPEGASEWLGDQVAQLSRQANADLAGLRYQHEDELRALYVNLMSTHIEQVIRVVATDREDSRYKQLMDSIEAKHAERVSEKDEKVRKAKARIVTGYEEHVKVLAEKAAKDAEAHYRERNKTRVERQQADAVVEIDREMSNAYTHDLQEILRIRRNDASLKLQVGQTQIFKVLAERQNENLAAEQDRLDRWKDEIGRIVADHRGDDIARTEALAEQLARTDELAAARSEHAAALEAQRAEHADRIRRTEEELDLAHQAAITKIKERDAEWGKDLSVERAKTETLTKQVQALREENAAIENRATEFAERRLQAVMADRDAADKNLERFAVLQRHASWLILSIIVGGVILGLGVGFIAGTLVTN
ncbi:coiled-coil domain-containing protein [Nocardiopsis metallicus]|uniref:Uncharacterized protein n=1 Tax=Nocardiopsis metallicus TaxID=179819 RepID=A0A840WI15_9ACTN|nr:hypothetical protein [Nocardiopsis metallicus]MBB5491327.1 hypothetical protein [Nocardiopsis metallicus]